jgi:hypothetical protein
MYAVKPAQGSAAAWAKSQPSGNHAKVCAVTVVFGHVAVIINRVPFFPLSDALTDCIDDAGDIQPEDKRILPAF